MPLKGLGGPSILQPRADNLRRRVPAAAGGSGRACRWRLFLPGRPRPGRSPSWPRPDCGSFIAPGLRRAAGHIKPGSKLVPGAASDVTETPILFLSARISLGLYATAVIFETHAARACRWPPGRCATGALVRYDNDGRPDLFNYGFGEPAVQKRHALPRRDGRERADGHHQTPSPRSRSRRHNRRSDLLVFFADTVDPFGSDYRVLVPRSDSRNAPQTLFPRATAASPTCRTAGIADNGVPVAIGYADVDNDGWQDVYVAKTTSGRPPHWKIDARLPT